MRELARRCATEKIAAMDLDATGIESRKREAENTYQRMSGYQALLALWAEMDVVVANEFRDGHLPACKDPLRLAQRAFAALPETVRKRYFRGDSICEDRALLS